MNLKKKSDNKDKNKNSNNKNNHNNQEMINKIPRRLLIRKVEKLQLYNFPHRLLKTWS